MKREKATAILIHIRKDIEECFPVGTIEEVHRGAGDVDFHIQTNRGRFAVTVTARFLEADDGLDRALNVLAGLPDALKLLDADHVLEVSQNEIQLRSTV
jgi:hypothetical protein